MTSADVLTLLSSGGYGIAALAIVVAGYLYRARETDRETRDKAAAADHETHVRLLETVLPLSAKLAEGVLAVERLAARRE